jgi:ribonuclease P protein component
VVKEPDSEPREASNRFGRELRITAPARISEVLKSGTVAIDHRLVVSALPNTCGLTRLGVTVPKRTGIAVVRNRWKRLIREAFRQQRGQLPAGYDLVVRPRRGAAPEFQPIARSMITLARRAARTVR